LAGTTAPAYAQNGQWGVHLEGVPDCGSEPCPLDAGNQTVTDNVIVNSPKGGILVDKGVHDSVISRNRIGMTLDGPEAGNGDFGAEIAAGSVHITLGPGNAIAYNATGVRIVPHSVEPFGTTMSPTYGDTITRNSIHDNNLAGTAALGIDLAPVGIVNT